MRRINLNAPITGGLGGKNGPRSIFGNSKAKEEMKAKLLAKARGEVVKEKDFKTQVWENIQQRRNEILQKDQRTQPFKLAGTQQQKLEESESYKRAKELMKQKQERKLKKQVKKRESMLIKGRYFGHFGRIDGKGRVMDAANKQILKVDLKTGKVTDKLGFKVGDYDPMNPTSVWHLENLIKKHTTVKNGKPHGGFWG